MVAVNRSFGAYTQADYDCQRCGGAETEEMKKRVRDFCRPYCDDCLEAMKHEGHGPGSGLLCYSSTTRVKMVMTDGKNRTAQETEHHPTIPIEQSPTRCPKCFPR